MYPFIELFGNPVSVYQIAVVVGVLSSLFTMYFLAKRNGLDEIKMLYLSLWCYGASFVGGTLLFGLTNIRLAVDLFSRPETFASFAAFWEALTTVFGGSVFYGGLLGILAASAIYRRKAGLPRRYADITAVGIPMFHFFGRIGCFLTGCCFGIECGFGFTFTESPVTPANGVCRFPVQLLEAAVNGLLTAALWVLFKKKKAQNSLINIYLYVYPVVRFADEFLRGDTYRGIWGPFSTSQWISLLLLAGNTAALLLRRRNRKQSAEETGNNPPAAG